MKILIDTHVFLWFINCSSRLRPNQREVLESNKDVLLSVVSLWEIAIKLSLGKLSLPGEFQEFLTQQLDVNNIRLLAVEIDHLKAVAALPFYHRDPFDRLLIAQAMSEELMLMSADKVFELYDVMLVG